MVKRPDSAITAEIRNDNATSTSGALTLADLELLGPDHSLAITLDGDGPYEFPIFGVDAEGTLADGSFRVKLDELAEKIRSGVRGLSESAVLQAVFLNFRCEPEGQTIVATSGTADGDGERSSVRFSNASLHNAAGILKLGTANGGREIEPAGAMRPAQTGTVGADLADLDIDSLAESASINVTTHVPGITPDDGPHTLVLWNGISGRAKPTTLEELRSRLQAALEDHSKAEFKHAQVTLLDSRLRIVAGGTCWATV